LWKEDGEPAAAPLPDDGQGEITALAWLDNETLATLGTKNRLCVWDLAREKLLHSTKLAGTGKGRFSPDGKLLASHHDLAGIRVWETATGRPHGTLFLVRPDGPGKTTPKAEFVAVSADGHYREEPPGLVDSEFVYVVRTAQGQDIFTPKEFAEKYRWKNDPGRVRVLGK
jgi:WD40 repeat protein